MDYQVQYPQQQGEPVVTNAFVNDDDRGYATAVHLVGLISAFDMMFLGMLATIIMWQIRKGKSSFIDDHCKEALNFQISMLIYLVVGGVLLGIGALVTLGVGLIVLLPLFFIAVFIMWILRLVSGIRGAMYAHRGELFRYPVCLRIFT